MGLARSALPKLSGNEVDMFKEQLLSWGGGREDERRVSFQWRFLGGGDGADPCPALVEGFQPSAGAGSGSAEPEALDKGDFLCPSSGPPHPSSLRLQRAEKEKPVRC